MTLQLVPPSQAETREKIREALDELRALNEEGKLVSFTAFVEKRGGEGRWALLSFGSNHHVETVGALHKMAFEILKANS